MDLSSIQSAAMEDSLQVFDEMPERTLFDVGPSRARPIKKLVAVTLAIIFISRVCKRMSKRMHRSPVETLVRRSQDLQDRSSMRESLMLKKKVGPSSSEQPARKNTNTILIWGINKEDVNPCIPMKKTNTIICETLEMVRHYEFDKDTNPSSVDGHDGSIGEEGVKLKSLAKFDPNIRRWKKSASMRPSPLRINNRNRKKINTNPYIPKKKTNTTRTCKTLEMVRRPDTNPLPFGGSIGDDALLYCALFPPDYEFEKDTLVQLWMAVGFFVEEPMERIAGLFFEDCLTKGYLQFSRTNLLTGKAMYKFKGDSQLLPKLISCCSHIVRIEGNSNLGVIYPEVAHVSVRCSDLTDSFVLHDYQRFKHLQTLILLHGHHMSFKQVSRDFFVFLRQLRVLDLSKTRLVELPSSIGNLKCLCFLDLSDTLIKRLPEAIDCLKKLQTLKLRGCSKLSTLPKGVRKLVNLRHLDFDVFRQLRSMPEWMGYLINIRTLSAFLIGVEQGCSVRQLKNMNYISGSFCISRLENVLTEDEAEEACLSLKTQIQKLELHWSDSQNEDAVGCEKILSSLQPTKSLAELIVSCYSGFELPSWICDPSFTKLVSITLFECENCLILPSLGQLPSLKYLSMVGFQKLKVIDHEFYGDSGIEGYMAFPKLEKLTIENMLSLEEWSGISSFEFPCLLNLTVKHCPKLHNLCKLSSLCSLEHLEISHCAMLASFSDDKLPARVDTFIIEDCPLISVRFLNGGEDWQRAAHIPHVWIDHKEVSYG